MAYFGNGAVNRVNLHFGIQAFAAGSGGLFALLVLLRAGVSIPLALLAIAAILAFRFMFRPVLLPLAKRWGLKPMLIVGTVGVACQYPLVPQVHGADMALLRFCLVAAAGDVFYWASYHAYFAAIGDAEHRGHQVGAREAVAAIVGIVAPLIGAWSLLTVGPGWTFLAVAAIQALAAVPLLGAPNVTIEREVPGAFRAARFGVAMFVTDGWFVACYNMIWQIALFVTLGQNYASYGGAMALAAVAGAVGGLLLGRHIDRGHGMRAVYLAYGMTSVVVLLRAASVGSPWLAVAANVPGALIAALLTPGLMAPVYNLAKASSCPLRFHIALEGGWDIGACSACLIAAAITGAGGSLALPMLMALPGAVCAVLLLRRYYSSAGSGAVA
jgi:DHA1 family inner membrane transport protein